MSSEENNTNKKNVKYSPLNPNFPNKKNNSKEKDNTPQKKSDIQFPSSTIASNNQNQELIKSDIIKLNQINIPDFLNNHDTNNKCNYFQSKKIDSENNSLSDKIICCYCTKTKCIKKYCECFSNNRYCKNCHCVNCLNKSIHLGNELPKESNENPQVFCTCTKSNCNKKYCECYKSNQKCSDKCRCINCKNCSYHPPSFNVNVSNNKDENVINNDINSNINTSDNLCDNNNDNKSEMINLEEEENGKDNNKEINSRKSSLDSNDSYKIQRVSVFINKYETVIDVEKFTKEMYYITKKRKKDLNYN